MATLPGTEPTGTLLLSAHYHSAAAGARRLRRRAAVATILETVRALLDVPAA
ncbi:hypothetical protein JCM9534A_39510 [Catenuloplanes indicus JCM 9534]